MPFEYVVSSSLYVGMLHAYRIKNCSSISNIKCHLPIVYVLTNCIYN